MTAFVADDFAAIAAKLKLLRKGKEEPAAEQPKTTERTLEDYMDSLDYTKNSSGY